MGDNQEEFRAVRNESLTEIRDMVTSLISVVEESDRRNKEKWVQSASEVGTVLGKTRANSASLGSREIFFDKSGEEFIEKRSPTLKKIKQLNLSARFMNDNMEILLNNDRSLIMIDNDFVAEVEIKEPSLLDETCNFQDAKQVLFSQLRIVRVLLNEPPPSESRKHQNLLLDGVECILKQSNVSWKNSTVCLRLLNIINMLKKTGSLTDSILLREINRRYIFDNDLRDHVHRLLETEETLLERKVLLNQLGMDLKDDSECLVEKLHPLLMKYAEKHRQVLIAIAPERLRGSIQNLSLERSMMITENDVKLFARIRSALNEEIFSQPLKDLEDEWMQRINSMEMNRADLGMPLIDEIFFYLGKSLEELVLEISEKANLNAADMIKSSSSGWQPISEITWNEETLETRCLEWQYRFMFNLFRHFKLGVDLSQNYFGYMLQILIGRSGDTKPKYRCIQDIVEQTERTDPFYSSEELFVWFCLLDHTLAHVFPENFPDHLKESITQCYFELIHSEHQLEAVRVGSHNIIRFVVKAAPYISPSNDPTEQEIIRKQMEIITFRKPSNNTICHDLILEFCKFWKLKKEIIDELSVKVPIPKMKLLQEKLLDIVLLALEKSVETETLLVFFRTYEAFLVEIDQRPFEWYIKDISNVDMKAIVSLKKIELVDNELKGTKHRSYRVLDSKNFPLLCRMLVDDSQMPRHYVIEILAEMITKVDFQLRRNSWTSNEKLTETDQLSTACELLSKIHHSLPYLRNQPAYKSFELFYKEKLKPFDFIIKDISSKQVFSARCRQITKSSDSNRNQHERDEGTLMTEYGKLNPTHDIQLLKKLYSKYCDHFDEFIHLASGRSYTTAAAIVAKEVKQLIPSALHHTKWDTTFKTEKVPQIIAGLAAVWAILESKDFETTGWYPVPYRVQILCILRLLSVDIPTKGIDNHLAELLPREGKSLVLAILAAFLALAGHDVHIVCHSPYLAQRDQNNFKAFYAILKVHSKVSVNCMKDELSQKNDIMHRLLFGKESATSFVFNNVVLFDDVQCFEISLNSSLDLHSTISGLDEIQVFIWKSVTEGCFDAAVVMDKVWKFTQSQTFSRVKVFERFINDKNDFTLVGCRSYNNRKLLIEHLLMMVNVAIEVSREPVSWFDFSLNSEGLIKSEWFEWGYYKIFNYFRLKKDNFVPQINCQYNYGYLDISEAFEARDLFSKSFSLLLGVSGMSLNLPDYKSLGVVKCSVIPTGFGHLTLLYDKCDTKLGTEDAWMKKIFSNTSKIIALNRSVIIFFKNSDDLGEFKAKYGSKFKRLSVLTESSDQKERIINEAGTCKTVTLTTGTMAVGVEFKPSETLEKNGGFHGIQAFSLDYFKLHYFNYSFESRIARNGEKGSFEILYHHNPI